MLKNFFKSDLDKRNTFRANPFVFNRGAKLQAKVDASFGSINIYDAVKCPPGEDINEWLAVNTVDFFNQANVLYGNLLEHCTHETCPVMCAGPKYQYLWADETVQKPLKCSAPVYVAYLMKWIQTKFDDSSVFPMHVNEEFGPQFLPTVRAIFKRLFRIYAHIYYHHFQILEVQQADKYLNMSFKHFVYFVRHFDLIDKMEMKPLETLIESFHEKDARPVGIPRIVEPMPQPQLPASRSPQYAPPVVVQASSPKPKQPIFVPSKASKEMEKHEQNTRSPAPQSRNPVEVRTKATLIIASEEPKEERSPLMDAVQEATSSYGSPLTPVIPPLAPPRSKRQNSKLHSPDIEEICIHEEEDEGLPSNVHASVTGKVHDRSNSPSALENVLKEINAEQVKVENHLSAYYDGLALEKSEGGLWTMSSAGDAQESKQLLVGFIPKIIIMGLSWETYFQVHVLRMAGFDVAGLWSLDQELLTRWSQDLNIPKCSTNITELLAIPNLQAVFACSLTRSEEKLMTETLKDLKIPLCISPTALPLPRRREILQLCSSSQNNQMISQYSFRYYPLMGRVREAIQEQKCGQVRHLQVAFQTNYKSLLDDLSELITVKTALPDLNRFVLSQLLDICCWTVDAETVESVFSSYDSADGLNADFVSVSFRTSNGVPGVLVLSFVNPCATNTFTMDVVGEAGQMSVKDSQVFFIEKGKRGAKLIMQDTSTETSFNMPFQSLSSASLHFFRSLKLHLFRENDKERTLSPNQMLLAQNLFKKAPSVSGSFLIMRAVEAINRQTSIDSSQILVVNNLLRMNPRMIKGINDLRAIMATEKTDNEQQTEGMPGQMPKIAERIDAQVEAKEEMQEACLMTDVPKMQSSFSQSEINLTLSVDALPAVSTPSRSAAKSTPEPPKRELMHEEPEPIPPPRRNKSTSSLECKDDQLDSPMTMLCRKFSGSAPDLATPPIVEPLRFPILVPPEIPRSKKHLEMFGVGDSVEDEPYIHFDRELE